jgi:BolA protein
MSLADEMRRRLAVLQPVRLEIEDESERHRGHVGWREGGETHWRIFIVSAKFAGQPKVSRHRMVYAALGELMKHPIHALAIAAHAPDESEADAGGRQGVA